MGIFNTKYSIVGNGAIIKVKNSAHTRCVLNSDGIYPKITELPESFEIIAPREAVKVIYGGIPKSYLHWMKTQEYIDIANKYHGNIY